MVISHFGLGMVKIQQGEQVIVFNPNLAKAKFGADLALVSLNDESYNGVEQVTRGEKKPFIIDGPGEYEVEGHFVHGFATEGPSGHINTVYLLVVDGLRLVHLGALAKPELTDRVVEALGTIDILFVPVDGLGPKGAAKLATALEPKVIVPTDFNDASLAAFVKELGEKPNGLVESWTVKRKDLADKAGEVVVIKSF